MLRPCQTPVPSVRAEDVPADAYLLDVREDDEWAAGPRARRAPLPMMEVPARLAEVPADRDVVVVCRIGGRSAQVVAYLVNQGWDNVRNLDGGMEDWAAGRPTGGQRGRQPGPRRSEPFHRWARRHWSSRTAAPPRRCRSTPSPRTCARSTRAPTALECDVRLTRDGHLVCVHDRRLDRTSNGRGRVSAAHPGRAGRAGLRLVAPAAPEDSDFPPDPDRARLLTLDRLLAAVRDAGRPVRLLIETKHPTRYGSDVERRLVGLLRRYGLAEPATRRRRSG